MRAPLWIGVLAVMVTGGLILGADDPKPPANPAGDFAGKVVLIYAKGAVKSAVLDGPAIRPLATRPFLVGKALRFGSPTSEGTGVLGEVWMPVDEIESLTVYDNLGQFKRSVGE